MSLDKPAPTGRFVTFPTDEIIVTKTDTRGRITYANALFVEVSGYAPQDLLGAAHSIVRHPAMPRCVFKLLWETVQAGEEFFGYVLNMNRQGDGYWVLAHVTPSYDAAGACVGYHSNRRSPHADGVEAATRLYRDLLAEEKGHSNPTAGLAAGMALLERTMAQRGQDYGQFAFSLSKQTSLDNLHP
ncbi:MAG: PAS domain-containing protein [bacterium]|jgi:PAS domain S-box-containing protein|nr:PAS domain-containing protein [bacterium]